MAKHPGKCPRCGNRLEYDSAVGDRIVCPHCEAALSIPGQAGPADPLLGQSLGEFEILEVIGRGGMGAVYQARQASLDRLVAVKVLPERLSADASFVARFNREARSAAAVSHPNIIEVFAIGEDKGCQFIAMELVDGESLAAILQRDGHLVADRALDVMKQTAAALAEAHACGILHRDIKPSNILLTARGRVKVADFGLAKHEGVDVTVTQTGQALGTPLYMPPEAARGEPLDARSDLYSLGATFYQALTGKPPFEGATPAELVAKHLEAKVPPLQQVVPDAPPALCRIVHRLLRKNPAERYESAEKLLEALGRIESRLAPAPDQPTATLAAAPRPTRATTRRRERAQPATRRRIPPWLWIAAPAFPAIMILIVVVISRSGRQPPTQATGTTTSIAPRSTDPAKLERNAETVFRNIGICIGRKDYTDAQGYLDRLLSQYGKTRFVAAHAADIAALQRQIDAYVKGTAKPRPPKPDTATPAQPQPPRPEPAPGWATLPNGWRVGEPVNLGPGVNSSAHDRHPCLSGDGLTLIFASDRPGGHGEMDVWMCTRRSAAEPWGEPVNLGPEINSAGKEESACLSSDGRTLIFAASRPGGLGMLDLWSSTRRGAGEPFGPPVNLGATVNSAAMEGGPCLSADGLTLICNSTRSGTYRLWTSTRRSAAEPWGELVELGPKINDDSGEGGACLSTDGLTLLFGSDWRGGHGSFDVWMCTRRSVAEPWSDAANPGPPISTRHDESGPFLSADGRWLYFHREAPGGHGGSDLYRAPILPAGAAPPDDEKRWTEWEDLFDGKTLDGWRVLKGGIWGAVRVDDGRLVLEKGSNPTAVVRDGAFPTTDYELTLDVMRFERSLSITFPVGDASCDLCLGKFGTPILAGLGAVDGKPGYENDTKREIQFESGRWYRARIRVTDQRIVAWLDDRKVTELATKGHTLRADAPGHPAPFRLSTWASAAAFRNIAVRRLMLPLPPPDAEGWMRLFDGKTLDGWTSTAKDRGRGSARVVDGCIELSGTNGLYRLNRAVGARDVILKAKVKETTPGEGAYGLQVRLGDDLHNYRVWIEDEQHAVIALGDGPRRHTVALKSGNTTKATREFRELVFSAIGDTLTFSVDGGEVVRVRDQTHRSGDVGIFAGNSRVLFKDIELKVLDKDWTPSSGIARSPRPSR